MAAMPISAPRSAYSTTSWPASSRRKRRNMATCGRLCRGVERDSDGGEELEDASQVEDAGDAPHREQRAEQRVLDQVLPVIPTNEDMNGASHVSLFFRSTEPITQAPL